MKLLRFISILLAVYIIAAIVILAPAAVSYGIVTGLLDSETLEPVSEEAEIRYQTTIYKNGGF